MVCTSVAKVTLRGIATPHFALSARFLSVIEERFYWWVVMTITQVKRRCFQLGPSVRKFSVVKVTRADAFTSERLAGISFG